jgi:hypothetical protein
MSSLCGFRTTAVSQFTYWIRVPVRGLVVQAGASGTPPERATDLAIPRRESGEMTYSAKRGAMLSNNSRSTYLETGIGAKEVQLRIFVLSGTEA